MLLISKLSDDRKGTSSYPLCQTQARQNPLYVPKQEQVILQSLLI